jgi:hypothetical protein
MGVIAFAWIKAKVPETKGKSLEEIQEALARARRRAEHAQRSDAPRRPGLSGADSRQKVAAPMSWGSDYASRT